jgi:hypothetical protein
MGASADKSGSAAASSSNQSANQSARSTSTTTEYKPWEFASAASGASFVHTISSSMGSSRTQCEVTNTVSYASTIKK